MKKHNQIKEIMRKNHPKVQLELIDYDLINILREKINYKLVGFLEYCLRGPLREELGGENHD